MADTKVHSNADAGELRGDTARLAALLGDAGLLSLAGEPASVRSCGPVHDLPSLRAFLLTYRDEVLLPRELPWILQAWQCAQDYQPRELITLDQQLAREPWLQELSIASRHVGRSQLRSLKPLRDLRVLKRYREAVEQGHAAGWHLIVYGLVLSAYSIPIRPGLLSYGLQTLNRFCESSARSIPVSAADLESLREELVEPLP